MGYSLERRSYAKWTDPFNPGGGSGIITDWKVGGKTLFVDPKGSGMISTIKSKNEPYEIVFEHLGEVIEGVEDTTSDRVKAWAGYLEEYHLSESNGITTLSVSIQTAEDWEKMLTNGFTKGLEIVRELAE